ncbi:MAG: ComEC/Rec2 family competence protein [Clostridia bacterium]|nr:ComEC/Rec2 family competence protein [Clostridia bacterium]
MQKMINFRPTVFVASGIALGILFAYFVVLNNVLAAVATAAAAVIVSVVFVCFSYSEFKKAGKVACFLIFTMFFAIGGLGFFRVANNYRSATLGGHKLLVSGSVSETVFDGEIVYAVLSDVRVKGAINGNAAYKAAVYIVGEKDLRLGDRVEFTAVVRDRSLIYDGKYAAGAVAEGIKYFSEVAASDVAVKERAPNLFQACNLYFFDNLKAGMGKDEFSVAYAMLTGNSDYMAEENLAFYRHAGVAHIFAVSGLHVGFLAAALWFILGKMRVNGYFSLAVVFACCLFYSGICGFTASSLRAVIMILFAGLAKAAGLKYDGLSSFSVAAAVILAVNPAQLFCVGFRLSFAVVFCIIMLMFPIKRLLNFLPDKISSAIAVSVSAEIGGIPVMLSVFGSFAALSAFVNILFVPIAGAVFLLLFVCAVFGGISPAVFLFLPNYAIKGLNAAIFAFDFRTFAVNGVSFGVFALLYYAAVAVAGGMLNLKRTAKAVTCVILAVFCVVFIFGSVAVNRQKVFVKAIGSESFCAVVLSKGEDNLLVISKATDRTFSTYRLKKATQGVSGGFSIVLLDSDQTPQLFNLLFRLNTVVKINSFYYCGEKDVDAESVIRKRYEHLTLVNLADGDFLPFGGGKCFAELYGRCLLCTINGYNTAVFAPLEGNDYRGLTPCPNTVIAYDSIGGICGEYCVDRVVVFRAVFGYDDGESAGDYVFTTG